MHTRRTAQSISMIPSGTLVHGKSGPITAREAANKIGGGFRNEYSHTFYSLRQGPAHGTKTEAVAINLLEYMLEYL